MNLRRITARTAVAGMTTALAAGALVGLGTTSAHAATVSNAYTCTTPVGALNATLTITGDLPVPEYSAGAPVPAGLVNVIADVDATTAGTLASVGAKELKISDFAIALGKGEVPIPLAGAVTGTDWDGKGTNEAFVTPDAGAAVAALMPKAMTVTAVLASGPVDFPCALAAGQTPAQLATIKLTKQDTTVTAPKKVAGEVGKATKVKVKVKGSAGAPATGKVVAKIGKKTVGNGKVKNGKAVVTVKKQKAGKYKVVLKFTGNGSFNKGKGKTTLTVKK
jgi:hypothetical protein